MFGWNTFVLKATYMIQPLGLAAEKWQHLSLILDSKANDRYTEHALHWKTDATKKQKPQIIIPPTPSKVGAEWEIHDDWNWKNTSRATPIHWKEHTIWIFFLGPY